MLFVITKQKTIQVSISKWETLLLNLELKMQVMCRIFNDRIIHIQTHTILDGGITRISHGATLKKWLDDLRA